MHNFDFITWIFHMRKKSSNFKQRTELAAGTNRKKKNVKLKVFTQAFYGFVGHLFVTVKIYATFVEVFCNLLRSENGLVILLYMGRSLGVVYTL